jgi:HEAT repeat protein
MTGKSQQKKIITEVKRQALGSVVPSRELMRSIEIIDANMKILMSKLESREDRKDALKKVLADLQNIKTNRKLKEELIAYFRGNLKKLIKSDPDAWIREEALIALGNVAKPEDYRIMVDALGDTETWVQHRALHELVNLWDHKMYRSSLYATDFTNVFRLLKSKNLRVQLNAFKLLEVARVEDSFIERLARSIRNPRNRLIAIRALGRIKEPKATRILLDSLKSTNNNVKKAALAALVPTRPNKIDFNKKDLQILNRLIKKENNVTRTNAVNVLRQATNSEEVVRMLEGVLKSNLSVDVRLSTIDALALLADQRAQSLLVGALKNSKPRIKRKAAEKLIEKIKFLPFTKANVQVLRDVHREDNDPRLKVCTIKLLVRAGKRYYTPEESEIAFVNRALDDKNPQVRVLAIHLLGWARNRRAVVAIRKKLTDPVSDVRGEASKALAYIGRDATKTKDYETEKEAKNPETIRLLAKLIEDPIPDIRKKAVEALTDLGGQKHSDIIIAALEDDNQDVRKAAIKGLAEVKFIPSKGDVPDLIEELGYPDPVVRKNLIAILMRTEQESAITEIERIAKNHTNSAVREQVKIVMKKIKSAKKG